MTIEQQQQLAKLRKMRKMSPEWYEQQELIAITNIKRIQTTHNVSEDLAFRVHKLVSSY